MLPIAVISIDSLIGASAESFRFHLHYTELHCLKRYCLMQDRMESVLL